MDEKSNIINNLIKLDNETLLERLNDINIIYSTVVIESLKRFHNDNFTDEQKNLFLNIQTHSSCNIFDSVDPSKLNHDDLLKGMRNFVNILSDKNR